MTDLQPLAVAMLSLARPNPDQSHPFVIETRIRELDGLFWDHEWGDLAQAIYWRWERCRAVLVGQIISGETK